MAKGMTRDEENMISELSNEVETRQQALLELGQAKNDVSVLISYYKHSFSPVMCLTAWEPKEYAGN